MAKVNGNNEAVKTAKRMRLLKNDVLIINAKISKLDAVGNPYTNFGECFIIRNGKRIFVDFTKRKEIYYDGTTEQRLKSEIKRIFNKEIEYLQDYPNIFYYETRTNQTCSKL